MIWAKKHDNAFFQGQKFHLLEFLISSSHAYCVSVRLFFSIQVYMMTIVWLVWAEMSNVFALQNQAPIRTLMLTVGWIKKEIWEEKGVRKSWKVCCSRKSYALQQNAALQWAGSHYCCGDHGFTFAYYSVYLFQVWWKHWNIFSSVPAHWKPSSFAIK